MSNWTQEGYDPSIHGYKKGWIDGANRGGYPMNYFFADSLRSIFIAFGSFFNDLFVVRYDENGEPIKQIQVPIKFGPRSKAFDHRTELASGKTYYITYPNMTYRMSGMQFDANRAAGMHETRMFYSNYFETHGVKTSMAQKFWRDIQPTPYNITITMEARCEHLSDANQIVEQIMSRFTPACNINVKEFWFCNIRRCIKVKCDSTDIQVTEDYGEEAKREITASFTFTVEAWLYKPIEYGAIIDQIVTTLQSDQSKTDFVWQNGISGNYDGSFDSRYNFSEIYGTKIGRMSAVKPESTLLVPNFETSSYYTKYEYEELPDITNYPYGSKQLYAVSSIWDPTSAHYNALIDENGYPKPAACSAMIAPEDKDFGFVYEVTYMPGFGNIPKDVSDPEMHVVLTAADAVFPRGGVMIKAYKDLSGYGDFTSSATWHFMTKDADLGTRVVKNAPVVTSAGILKEDK